MSEGLDGFRRRLDAIDDAIARRFGERFEICRAIARYKSAHEIAMMQPGRVEQVRARYLARGADVDLPPQFSADLFELVIAATCKMEDELMDAAVTGGPDPLPHDRSQARRPVAGRRKAVSER
ncbi:MAG TPA: chorismate mutase [Solirubrobacteraceae bacterium]|nr:chorismate mutase [Solirubrobacteraceae bacterium]